MWVEEQTSVTRESLQEKKHRCWLFLRIPVVVDGGQVWMGRFQSPHWHLPQWHPLLAILSEHFKMCKIWYNFEMITKEGFFFSFFFLFFFFFCCFYVMAEPFLILQLNSYFKNLPRNTLLLFLWTSWSLSFRSNFRSAWFINFSYRPVSGWPQSQERLWPKQSSPFRPPLPRPQAYWLLETLFSFFSNQTNQGIASHPGINTSNHKAPDDLLFHYNRCSIKLYYIKMGFVLELFYRRLVYVINCSHWKSELWWVSHKTGRIKLGEWLLWSSSKAHKIGLCILTVLILLRHFIKRARIVISTTF